MEEIAVREYRVWCVNGDIAGCANVYKRRAWWTVELEPFYYADRTKPKGFRSQEAAYKYAAEHADEYLSQVLEWVVMVGVVVELMLPFQTSH